MNRFLVLSIVFASLLLCGVANGVDGVGSSGQKVTSTDGETLVAAKEGQYIKIHSVVILATSTTSVGLKLYNDDNDLLGEDSNRLTVDLDGIDGPAGIVIPFNDAGWFTTDATNEAVKLGLSAATTVIVIVNYSYSYAAD